MKIIGTSSYEEIMLAVNPGKKYWDGNLKKTGKW
jgi:hypothetical protein